MKLYYPCIIITLIISLFLYSCGTSEKQEIQKLLSKRETAIETKNTELYIDCISEQYNYTIDGKIIDFNDVRKSFESNSKIFDSIELTSSDINIYMQDNNSKADVYQKTQYRLTIEKEQSRYTILEELSLQKIKGDWKITKEADVDLFKVFAFGS